MDSVLPQHSFGTGELSLFESIFESLLMDGFSATVYIYIYSLYRMNGLRSKASFES